MHALEVMASYHAAVDIAGAGISSKSHHPESFSFPKQEFGQRTILKRAFQRGWFKSRPWLHYDVSNNTVLCHTVYKLQCKVRYVPGEKGHKEGWKLVIL